MAEINLIKIDGKPLEKLIDVISKGVGTIYKPRAIRKEAEARSYEIEIVERAKAKAIAEGKEIDAAVYERIQERMLHQETKRQLNIDNVSQIAAEQLSQEETVSEEPVDEDWSTRFFNIIEDISDEEMQNLWGRILAGEVKQPKSYSLRTLELLKNLSKNEADIFTKVANFAIKSGNEYFLFKGKDQNLLKEKYRIAYNDIALLTEIGLLQPGTFVNYEFHQQTSDYQNVFISGNLVIVIKIKANTPTIQIPVDVFSNAGNELLKLIKSNSPMDYLTSLANSIKSENVEVKYAHILAFEENMIRHTQPLQDF